MCPPDFYGIHYEINPWMDMSRQAEHAVAVEQWQALHRHIAEAGAQRFAAGAGRGSARSRVHRQRGDDLSAGRR